ncbi:MAG: trypsin-like peptidase domain-containing protein, partial [Planctomycetota bacterium]
EAPQLDLAVCQIVADSKGRRLSNLDLPFVEIGNSDELQLGERLSIFGYPGIGGETVTFTSGNVSGFSQERGVARAWIKTDATIAGGNSGGTAVNQEGHLVGIPTQAAAGSGITPVDARPVLDTNRDGRVDRRDTPMAVGGFINGLRPVNLALPLLAKAGVDVDPATRKRSRSSISIPDFKGLKEKPEFSHLLFSTSVTEDGRPINPTTHIPSGVDTVYATFEHDNLEKGTPWSVVWMSDGDVIIDQKDVWDEAEEGRKAVKISNRKGLPPGEYHLVLGIGNAVALEGKVMVGRPVDDTDSQVSGRLVDSRSGRPIDQGIVIVLNPNASLREFMRTQDNSLVFTSAEPQSDGSFEFPHQLPKGQAYSLVAAAPGYRPVAVEGALRVSPGAPEKADIGEIEMDRA